MGDDDSDNSFARRYPPTSPMSKRHRSPFTLNRILLPLIYGAALLSCGGSLRTRSKLSRIAEKLGAEFEFLQGRNLDTLQLFNEVTAKQTQVAEKYQDLKATMDRLQHEMRMREEMMERIPMSDSNRDLLMKQLNKKQKDTALTWIQQRQEALYGKIFLLQDMVREQSRQQAMEKYGPGPHRVEFQVQVVGKKKASKFLVELAPLSVMPHSVETFLDMVTSGLWDNTVFYHHAKHDHVVAAAPVNYGSFEAKNHHFEALGFKGLSFPEYSETFSHEEYTIGFSGRGPNFYINAMDNSEHHGPGGQQHHDLSEDADPCFGKILWGKNVIQDMMPKKSRGKENPVSWQDYDLTQIIKVRLVKNE